MNSKTTSTKRKNSGLKTAVVPEDMPNKEIEFRLTQLKENADGSVDCKLDMNPYTHAKLVEMAVIGLIKMGIESEQKKLPWYKRIFKKL